MRIYNHIYIFCIFVGCCILAIVQISRFHSNSFQNGKILKKVDMTEGKIRGPRITIDIQEDIEGIKDEKSASNWLKEKSANYGIRIVEPDPVVFTGTKRAGVLGRDNEAKLRKEGIVSNYDYLIQGTVSGSQTREEGLYGSKGGIRFSLGMDVSVIEAVTGAVVVTVSLPPQDIFVRSITSKQAASKEAIIRLMRGTVKTIGAEELFRKMDSHWTAEKDFGELYRMEFVGLDLEKAHLLENTLASISGINDLKICSVDAAGVSVLECQSKLSSLDLASLIQKTITGFKLDRSDARYLSFRKNGKDISILESTTNNVVAADRNAVLPTKDNSHIVIEVKSSSWMDKFLELILEKLLGWVMLFFGVIGEFVKKKYRMNKLFYMVLGVILISTRSFATVENDPFSQLEEDLTSSISIGTAPVRLGVGNFLYQDTKMMSPFSSKIRDEIEMKLSRNKSVVVVTRDRISELEDELQFQKGYDLVEPGTEVNDFKIKGVEVIVRGRFYVEGNNVVIYTEVVWLNGGKVDKMKTVCSLKDFVKVVYPLNQKGENQLKTEWIVPQNVETSQQGIEEVCHQNLFKIRREIVLKLRTNDGERIYQEGDSVSFRVKADRDCHIAVICHQSDGTSVILFPNQWQKDTLIAADKTIEVPGAQKSGFEIEIGEPFGADVVQVIACTDENALHRELKEMVSKTTSNEPYAVMARGMFVKKANAAIQELKTGKMHWGENHIVVSTHPRK